MSEKKQKKNKKEKRDKDRDQNIPGQQQQFREINETDISANEMVSTNNDGTTF